MRAESMRQKEVEVKKNWFLVAGLLLALVLVIVGLVGCTGNNTGVGSPGLPSNLAVNVGTQQEGISVSGLGELAVVPDVVNISLGVSAQAKTVAEAQSAASVAMNDVINALTQGGVDKKDIQTQYFSIQQVTRYDNTTQQEVVIGYRVSNMVAAKIRDVGKAGSIIDAVATAGGDLTRINSISFDVDNPSQYYSDVRQKAMNDANTKAKQLADLGGVTLGKPTFISESMTSVPPPRPILSGGAAPAPAVTTPISPGETKITLNVQVVYAIQK